MSGFAVAMSIKYSISEYRRFKIIEKEHIQLTDEKQQLEIKVDSLILVSDEYLKVTKKKSTTIDKKLKHDEEIIDNTDVTNDELGEFFSKHGEN